MAQAGKADRASPQAIPVTQLSGVGPRLAERLAQFGIESVQDLLFHLPIRYEDRTKIIPIGGLRAGESAVVCGRIELSSVRFGRRRSLLTRISDGTGYFTMRLFHFSKQQQQGLEENEWIQCFGEARFGPGGVEMVHPEYRLFKEKPLVGLEETLTPVYSSTEGINQRTLRKLTDAALAIAQNRLIDWLPVPVCKEQGFPGLTNAIETVHWPSAQEDTAAILEGRHPAQQRFAFEELLAHHLSLKRLRIRRANASAPAMRPSRDLWQKLQQRLPFDLTGAQKRVIDELFKDLSRASPAQRLVQGDVGSGKTVVAAAAAALVMDTGYQTAIMAPTELLAEQHARTLNTWFEPLDIIVTLLSGRLKVAARRKVMAQISSGEAGLVVGTHALFQDAVTFANLGLIIVDEQHRFGVDQRLALRDKSSNEFDTVHQITMTATPIPRSLAMTFYADLDVSSLDELPPGRTPVETVVLPSERRLEVQNRVRDACAGGRQAYWVCPLIDESDVLQAQAATETEANLKKALPHLRVGLIHGRMHGKEKDLIMSQFRQGHIDLLVATTVIEVGVDVPNASLMIIENAERLGLAQLHQLRGRIGRGSQKSVCVLMYQGPLGRLAKDRLSILRKTNNGFEIAQRDLEQRGPGEVLGTRQTGLQRLRIADLSRDQKLLPAITQAARKIQRDWPGHIEPLIKRWVSEAEHYADV